MVASQKIEYIKEKENRVVCTKDYKNKSQLSMTVVNFSARLIALVSPGSINKCEFPMFGV